MTIYKRAVLAFTGLAMIALAACEPVEPVPTPRSRPEGSPQVTISAASFALRAHYARVQADLLAQGLLRTDGGGPDVPFNERQLTDNFLRIALYDEYVSGGGRLIARQTASRLRRWEQPVRIALRFGASVPPAERAADRAKVVAYAARLARVTGHSIRVSDNAPNYFVYIVNEDERRALGTELVTSDTGLSVDDFNAIANLPRSTFCLVYAMSRGETGSYARAVAVIRAEHPDLLRLSCIHEELAQGLGLANDSPAARPSIFNDDEEFGLLTRQDELMLKMLYDPRLSPGMTEYEARPVVRILAHELMGGSS
jgi:hypothetical protein